MKNKKNAFTLAEMMIVMLILSIVTAAFLPIITKRSKTTSQIWQYAANNSDIFAQTGSTQGAMIGTNNASSTGEDGKLTINTPGALTNHIRMEEDHVYTGYMNANARGFVGLGTVSDREVETNPSAENAVAIGTNTQVWGDYSTAIGIASYAKTYYSVALGYQAIASADHSIAIGSAPVTNGSNSMAIGHSAQSRENSVALGNTAQIGEHLNNSIAIGYLSSILSDNTGMTIGGGIAIGNSAKIAYSNTLSGSSSIAIGDYSYSKDGGMAIGRFAKANDVYSTAVGRETLIYNTGVKNTAFGYGALKSDIDNTQAGSNNTAIGYGVLNGNTTGKENVAVGERVQVVNTTGHNNTGVGYEALLSNTTGNLNVAVGHSALKSNTTGGSNVAVGYLSLNNNISGGNNTAVGHYSLNINSSGLSNTAVGQWGCQYVQGDNKICLGYNAGPPSGHAWASAADKEERVFIGRKSYYNNEPAVLEVHNPSNATPNVASAVNTPVVIINGNLVVRGRTFINSGSDESVYIPRAIRSSGDLTQSGSWDWPGLSSDRRLKNVGKTFDSGLDKVRELKVYNYVFKKDPKKTKRVGVIAQDLQKIFPNAVRKGEDGFLEIRQEDMFYAMLNSIKELDVIVQNIVKDLKIVKEKVQTLVVKVQTLDDKVAALFKVNQIESAEIKNLKKQNKELVNKNKSLENQISKINQRLAKLEKTK